MSLTIDQSLELHMAVVKLVNATARGHPSDLMLRKVWDACWSDYTAMMARLTEGTTAFKRDDQGEE